MQGVWIQGLWIQEEDMRSGKWGKETQEREQQTEHRDCLDVMRKCMVYFRLMPEERAMDLKIIARVTGISNDAD